MPQDLPVEVVNLQKAFDKTKALDGVSLSVPLGQVHALLGPNGAGKTTLVRILSTLLSYDAGEARIFGHDVGDQASDVRRLISLTGQFASVDDGLTGRENLILMGRLHGYPWPQARSRADDLLSAFGLTGAADRLTSTYSGGMRRRLDIAASIVVAPRLLFLDEPTTGLDPRSRLQVWEIVRALVASGTTVVLTTQNLEEADRLADQITVIDHGEVIAQGAPSELKASVGAHVLRVTVARHEQRAEALDLLQDRFDAAPSRDGMPGSITAQIGRVQEGLAGVAALEQNDIPVAEVTMGQATLDEVFLTLTGHSTQTDGETAEIERNTDEHGSLQQHS